MSGDEFKDLLDARDLAAELHSEWCEEYPEPYVVHCRNEAYQHLLELQAKIDAEIEAEAQAGL